MWVHERTVSLTFHVVAKSWLSKTYVIVILKYHSVLTLACYVNLHDFVVICFSKKFFQAHNQSVKQFGSRAGPVGSNLGPNSLQRLPADNKSCYSKEKVKLK